MSFVGRTFLLLGLIVFLAIPAGAQTETVNEMGATVRGVIVPASFSCSMFVRPMMGIAVAGATEPYSGVRESSSVQTLADGTHITRDTVSEKVYRDSQGRMRTERPMCHRSLEESDAAVYVEIRDPVAGYAYILDPGSQTAHRFVLKVHEMSTKPREGVAMGALAVQTGGFGAPPLPPMPDLEGTKVATLAVQGTVRDARQNTSTESLGTQTMEGVVVEGTRTTHIIPVGEAGNDRPMTVVREIWFAPSLKVTILMKTTDPRFGEQTNRLTNVDTSEPNLSLFQPPADYKVVDETEAVKITYSKQ
jgi:hypothetical protein